MVDDDESGGGNAVVLCDAGGGAGASWAGEFRLTMLVTMFSCLFSLILFKKKVLLRKMIVG